ncbi:hypothetical protein TEA_012395 [Camellia sinensis var. sinensis]|uniref:RING-type domain-containing protein n=1 Tax=Camellia sinensis var. sinensis TaxID=542762 RepID=A0A4S4DBX4_CAMSN|nr:hypothetical protein TEA_012395 [Camellia sinensis var. sinensis]
MLSFPMTKQYGTCYEARVPKKCYHTHIGYLPGTSTRTDGMYAFRILEIRTGVLIKMTPVCPFVKAAPPDDASLKKVGDNQNKIQSGQEGKAKQESGESTSISPKCPFGYDSQTFKLGPFSCMICQALLFESCKCVPCSHVYCKACISRFKDCPLCGADIEKIEADTNLQNVVDRFIEGHARIKRSQVNTDEEEAVGERKTVIYEDVSLERGAFLVQQAMRAFRAHNVESAKSRLSLCAEDIREQLERMGNTSELCSQLGAVLGMLGDCWSVLFLIPSS